MSELYMLIQTLCKEKNVSIGKMCNELGISRGNLTELKMERIRTLKSDNLTKISNYFNVTVDYLLGNEKKPVPQGDELVKDEFVAFYGDTKKDLSQADIEDIKTLMRIRAELNRGKE